MPLDVNRIQLYPLCREHFTPVSLMSLFTNIDICTYVCVYKSRFLE